MKLDFLLLDVFADVPFQGTQIPVMICRGSVPEDQVKTAIAGEFQQTETVFIDLVGNIPSVNVFNPQGKTVFGAHTILAASYIAYELNITEDKGDYAAFDITQDDQLIQCFIDKTEHGPGSIQFTRLLNPGFDRFTPPLSRIAEALNIDDRALSSSKYHPMVVSIDQPTLIVPINKAEQVYDAKLNTELWNELLSEIYVSNLFLFAPRLAGNLTDFHGRLINPSTAPGVYPPIGNVMPEFIAYLAEQKETAMGTHTFSIDRGSANTRKSILHAEFDKREGKAIQCRIGGNVIKMAAGSMEIP